MMTPADSFSSTGEELIVSADGEVIRVTDELQDDVTEALESVSVANQAVESAKQTITSLAVQHLVPHHSSCHYFSSHVQSLGMSSRHRTWRLFSVAGQHRTVMQMEVVH